MSRTSTCGVMPDESCPTRYSGVWRLSRSTAEVNDFALTLPLQGELRYILGLEITEITEFTEFTEFTTKERG